MLRIFFPHLILSFLHFLCSIRLFYRLCLYIGNNIRFALLNVFNVVASALLFIRCVHVIFFYFSFTFFSVVGSILKNTQYREKERERERRMANKQKEESIQFYTVYF